MVRIIFLAKLNQRKVIGSNTSASESGLNSTEVDNPKAYSQSTTITTTTITTTTTTTTTSSESEYGPKVYRSSESVCKSSVSKKRVPTKSGDLYNVWACTKADGNTELLSFQKIVKKRPKRYRQSTYRQALFEWRSSLDRRKLLPPAMRVQSKQKLWRS